MKEKIQIGENLYIEGKVRESEELFLSIIETYPESKEALNNLGVIANDRGSVSEAEDYFKRAIEIDSYYKNAILNYASVLHSQNKLDTLLPLINGFLKQYPNDDELKQVLNLIGPVNREKQKILFLCLPGQDSFLHDIIESLSNEFEVCLFKFSHFSEIETAIKDFDTVWLEWANELAIKATNHPTLLKGKRVICRLHSYEALSGFVQQIKWEMVSELIFVADHIMNIVIQQIPDIEDKIQGNLHTVPNGINLEKYRFKEREAGFNLAYLGNINFKKGPMLLLHAFMELLEKDSRYKLYIAGQFQEIRYSLYFNQMIKEFGIEDNICAEGWIKNVSEWLDDKQYIICSSVLEGHPVGVMEAMACGIKPVIHNYVGARGSYPEKYIWNSISEFVKMIMDNEYSSLEYRSYISDNFSLESQINALTKIIFKNRITQ